MQFNIHCINSYMICKHRPVKSTSIVTVCLRCHPTVYSVVTVALKNLLVRSFNKILQPLLSVSEVDHRFLGQIFLTGSNNNFVFIHILVIEIISIINNCRPLSISITLCVCVCMCVCVCCLLYTSRCV